MAEYIVTDTELTAIADTIRRHNNLNIYDPSATSIELDPNKEYIFSKYVTMDGNTDEVNICIFTKADDTWEDSTYVFTQTPSAGTVVRVYKTFTNAISVQNVSNSDLLETNIQLEVGYTSPTAYRTFQKFEFPNGFVSAIKNIPSSEEVQALIDGSMSTYTNSTVKYIRTYAFYNCDLLTQVAFPECTTIATHAFDNCNALSSISFPMCQWVSNYAFQFCSALTEANFPECTLIGIAAFSSCISLSKISFPKCTTINNYAFASCSSLSEAIFPNCTIINTAAFGNCQSLSNISFSQCTFISGSAFQSCVSLQNVSFPECLTIGGSAFQGCTFLSNISFPKCKVISSCAFQWCNSLQAADFPACQSIYTSAFSACFTLSLVSLPACINIYSNAFNGCNNLISVYLLGSQYISLSNSNAFLGTPMTSDSYVGSYGTIYVPASMLNTYKTKTNWSFYKDRFVGI